MKGKCPECHRHTGDGRFCSDRCRADFLSKSSSALESILDRVTLSRDELRAELREKDAQLAALQRRVKNLTVDRDDLREEVRLLRAHLHKANGDRATSEQ